MPTLNQYEKFFDSIGIDEKKRAIVAAETSGAQIPDHGGDLDSEWITFGFAGGIEITVGPEEAAWLQTVCSAPIESAISEDEASYTHRCVMPGRELYFSVEPEVVVETLVSLE